MIAPRCAVKECLARAVPGEKHCARCAEELAGLEQMAKLYDFENHRRAWHPVPVPPAARPDRKRSLVRELIERAAVSGAVLYMLWIVWELLRGLIWLKGWY